MNVACFPAIGTVIFSIGAEADPFEPLAVATVAIASAVPLGFIALHAQRCGSHFFTLTVCRPGLARRESQHIPANFDYSQPGCSEQDAIVVLRNTSRIPGR
jgi:hypothetical protein